MSSRSPPYSRNSSYSVEGRARGEGREGDKEGGERLHHTRYRRGGLVCCVVWGGSDEYIENSCRHIIRCLLHLRRLSDEVGFGIKMNSSFSEHSVPPCSHARRRGVGQLSESAVQEQVHRGSGSNKYVLPSMSSTAAMHTS